MKKSPLAPRNFPDMPPLKGVRLATKALGLKYEGRDDVLCVLCDDDTQVAGVFTTSKTASANIQWGKEIREYGLGKVLLVNAGNANAFNGRAGEESVARIVKAVCKQFNVEKYTVYPCATGVIGEPLDDRRITEALADLEALLSEDQWEQAAHAIMTTDTFAKGATRNVKIGDSDVTINGIAKGSGMIAPDMATMLSYIFTDAAIDARSLQALLEQMVDETFNAITVDSDTSTSDTLLLFATGQAGGPVIDDVNSPELNEFKDALFEIMQDLAHQIVKDGEGASKFIKIHVQGAENHCAAKRIAMAIANSPLVKTAIAGEDANWGRIIMAIGKSGEHALRDQIRLAIGGELIVEHGQVAPGYNEDNVTQHMKGENIVIDVDLNIAQGEFTAWTCDLTHDYITINADYRS